LVLRKVAGLALAAGVLVSVAGCSFNPSPDTLQSYAPSDGVGVDLNFGKAHRNEALKIRNFLIVTDGTQSALFGTVINSGDKPESLNIQLGSDSAQQQTFSIEAGQTFVFDQSNKTTLPLPTKAGETVKIAVVAAGGNINEVMDVPVLDGTIDYYKNLLTPAATPAETPSPAATN